MKLLVVEDEQELLDRMLSFLREEAAIAIGAQDIFEAEEKLLLHQFDLVVLDIGLPDGSGLNLIERIKSLQSNAAVLIVSAKNALEDKVTGLDLGADDYMTKPFHLAELRSRINAILRRNMPMQEKELVFNEITVKQESPSAFVHGEEIELTKKEYQLLAFFIVNKDRVLTKESLVQHLWGDHIEYAENFDFIYTHIKNLRKKIVNKGGNDYLKTVYGVGYKYTDR